MLPAAPANSSRWPAMKTHQKDCGDDPQQGMEQRVGHIEKSGIAECRHIGAVRDQKEAEDE